MAILKNSLIVAFGTLGSRGLGLVRDLIIANRLGAGLASDTFFIALQLPNLLRRLLGEGAFNVAFVPALAREKARGEEDAVAYANAILSWLLPILAVLTVLGLLLMPVIVRIMVPGWVSDPVKFDLTVALGRITFPYLMLICLASFLGAICNTYNRFAAYALAPALLNVSFIVLLLLYPWYGPAFGMSPAEVAAWAVPIGGVAQLLFMIWHLRKLGFKLSIKKPTAHVGVKPLLKRMGPAALGVGVLQLSLVIDNFVASWVGEGAVSYLQYANRFYQFPLALIGIAVATVLLPHLASLLGANNKKEASTSFTKTLMGCLTLATGATVGLFFLAPELMATLLMHGAFTLDAAQATSWAMMAFALGLPMFILTKVTAPAFFASEDTVSPVKASGYALLVNLVVNIVFVVVCLRAGLESIAHIGIALATTIGGAVNAYLQWRWLRLKGVLEIDTAPLYHDLRKLAVVAGGMTVVLLGYKLFWPYEVMWGLPLKLLWLMIVGGSAAGAFVLLVHGTGVMDVHAFMREFKKPRKVDPKLRAAMRDEG